MFTFVCTVVGLGEHIIDDVELGERRKNDLTLDFSVCVCPVVECRY